MNVPSRALAREGIVLPCPPKLPLYLRVKTVIAARQTQPEGAHIRKGTFRNSEGTGIADTDPPYLMFAAVKGQEKQQERIGLALGKTARPQRGICRDNLCTVLDIDINRSAGAVIEAVSSISIKCEDQVLPILPMDAAQVQRDVF